MIKTLIIVLSDRAYNKEREDISGENLKTIMEKNKFNVVKKIIIPDEKLELKALLKEYINKVDIILTAGGTGITKRDITPDVTKEFLEKRLSGLEYGMISEGLKFTPMAIISRAVSGISGETLIINLPGNPNSYKQSFLPFLPAVKHIIQKIKNQDEDCFNQLKEL